jgi:ABC-type thiamine transport system ATPase subunit
LPRQRYTFTANAPPGHIATLALFVVAPSGSGKTTLLRLIAGLEVPAEGEICLAGRTGRALLEPSIASCVSIGEASSRGCSDGSMSQQST